MSFLSEALKAPGRMGAIAPSSPNLARKIVACAELGTARTIVEIGPGTGPITREIHKSMAADARLILVEINPQFAQSLSTAFPSADVICGSAEDLTAHLATRGLASCDRVVCGLPWTAFPADLQTRILDAVVAALAPDGIFVTFAYTPMNHLPRGKSFYRLLRERFSEVGKSPLAANLPPAFSYICRP